jgi:hypothetical protein
VAVHIKEMTSEVAVFEGELPLTPKQTEALVKKVIEKLAEKTKNEAQAARATSLRRSATPQLPVED